MHIGDRVCHIDGSVGFVEAVDDDPAWPNADVRWLTPDNAPSCVVSLCKQSDLTLVGENVLPQPRSKEWKKKSKDFYDMVTNAIEASGVCK